MPIRRAISDTVTAPAPSACTMAIAWLSASSFVA